MLRRAKLMPNIDKKTVASVLTRLKFKAVFIKYDTSYRFDVDPKDAPFIYLYEKSNPDFVVSDDKHFEMSIIARSKLMNTRQFVQWVVDNN